MASQTYITREGDVLDWIVWRQYGRLQERLVELVLEANRGLADYGPILPAGVSVVLPELPRATRTQGVRLWD